MNDTLPTQAGFMRMLDAYERTAARYDRNSSEKNEAALDAARYALRDAWRAALGALPAPSRSERTEDAPDGEETCVCGRIRDEHGGPYGEGACDMSGCEAFEAAPAAPQTTPAPEGKTCRDHDCVLVEGHAGHHENRAGWKFSDPAPGKEDDRGE